MSRKLQRVKNYTATIGVHDAASTCNLHKGMPEGFCVARLLHYDNRETPLAGNFVGRCQGHKSDVSTQSWVLISEKDNVTISGRCLYTHEWRELVTGGEVGNGMEKIMAIII